MDQKADLLSGLSLVVYQADYGPGELGHFEDGQPLVRASGRKWEVGLKVKCDCLLIDYMHVMSGGVN